MAEQPGQETQSGFILDADDHIAHDREFLPQRDFRGGVAQIRFADTGFMQNRPYGEAATQGEVGQQGGAGDGPQLRQLFRHSGILANFRLPRAVTGR